MDEDDERLATFSGWPHTSVTPAALARSGFYYLGRGDEVRCAYCKVELMRWAEGVDVSEQHRRWAPQCPLFSPGTPPHHPHYSSMNARIASFANWPSQMRPKPHELADAGWFYTGHGDETICFFCNGAVKHWDRDDDPWVEHARWFRNCDYVRIEKGPDYVQQVMSEACVVRASGSSAGGEPTNQDQNLCKICCERVRDVCFYPCGHVFACAKCAAELSKCPMCRKNFKTITRLYYA